MAATSAGGVGVGTAGSVPEDSTHPGFSGDLGTCISTKVLSFPSAGDGLPERHSVKIGRC